MVLTLCMVQKWTSESGKRTNLLEMCGQLLPRPGQTRWNFWSGAVNCLPK
jgi:hypothetical protein